MIDFIKLRFRDAEVLKIQLEDSDKFKKVIGVIEMNNMTELPTKYSNYGEMKVKVTQKYGEISGSLHKHWNLQYGNDIQNYNDFTYFSISKTVDEISKHFENINNGFVTKLEIGFNIEMIMNVDDILQKNVVMHDFDYYSVADRFRGDGFLKRFVYSEYDIKIYNKGRQFELEKEVLRFEIVLKGNRAIRRLGVVNILSLKDKNVLRKLFLRVRKVFDDMIVLDNFYKISSKDRDLMYRYTNPLFWNYHIVNTTYSNKSNHRKKFYEVVEKYELDKTKKTIIDELIKKYLFVINN